jgi:hypothetical protein
VRSILAHMQAEPVFRGDEEIVALVAQMIARHGSRSRRVILQREISARIRQNVELPQRSATC